MNAVQLIGRISKDPELRYTTSNTPVLMFSLAVDRRKKEDGTKEVDWIDCVAWQTTAELISKYVSKGDLLGINGKLQKRTWEDTEKKKHSITEVIVTEITLIGSKEKPEKKQEIPEPGYNDGEDEEGCPF